MSDKSIEILMDIRYFSHSFKSHRPCSVCGFFIVETIEKSVLLLNQSEFKRISQNYLPLLGYFTK